MMRALFVAKVTLQVQRAAFVQTKIAQHAIFSCRPLTPGKFGQPVQALGMLNNQLTLINTGDLRTALRPLVLDPITGQQRRLQPGEFVRL